MRLGHKKQKNGKRGASRRNIGRRAIAGFVAVGIAWSRDGKEATNRIKDRENINDWWSWNKETT